MDKRTGKSQGVSPEFIKNGDSAVVKLAPSKPLCVESFKKYAPLGRFAVRDMRQVILSFIFEFLCCTHSPWWRALWLVSPP